ncbi:hypothetical protein [Nonomuraea salmonea]|uniref:hypothetical protein n=1 Tax=Nonomuraea salmonea TaxID=46181 RepID=UPI002FEB0D68
MHSTAPSGMCGRYGSTPAVTVCTSRNDVILASVPGTSGTVTRGGTHTSTSSTPSGIGTLLL